jgi:uncharacterized OsmC-like protein
VISIEQIAKRQMSRKREESPVNGLDPAKLGKTLNAMRRDSTLARFSFRAANHWIDAGYNRTVIHDFRHAGQENDSRILPFIMDSDAPRVLLGRDFGPTPVEILLHALGSCLTTSIVYRAAACGIHIVELESDVEGELDMRGLFGMHGEVRPGFQSINVNVRARTDATQEQLRLFSESSPVFDMLSKPVPVSIQMQTM